MFMVFQPVACTRKFLLQLRHWETQNRPPLECSKAHKPARISQTDHSLHNPKPNTMENLLKNLKTVGKGPIQVSVRCFQDGQQAFSFRILFWKPQDDSKCQKLLEAEKMLHAKLEVPSRWMDHNTREAEKYHSVSHNRIFTRERKCLWENGVLKVLEFILSIIK